MLAKNLEEANLQMPVEVVDIDVSPEIASDFGVRSVPTLVMLDWNTEIKRVSGNQSTQQLKEWANGQEVKQ
jgi:thioredoxin-like negative regulator of GroEL